MAGPSTSTHLALNRACNQRCGFCVVRAADPDSSRDRAARAVQALQLAARAGHRTVVLGGGEPLLEPWVEALIAKARALGVPEIVLETNATRVDAARARALAAAGLARAIVACNSLEPEVADGISGDPGGAARTAAGIRALLDAGVAVDLTVVLLPANRGALADLVARSATVLPAGRARVEAVVARHVAVAADRGPVLDPAFAAAELEAACRAVRPDGPALRPAPGCDLPPCVFADPVAARPVLRLGHALVERESARFARLPACAVCALHTSCPGVQPALAAGLAAWPPLDAGVAARLGDAAPVVRRDAAAPWQVIGLHPQHALAPDHAVRLAAPRPPAPPDPRRQHGPLPDREALELGAGLRDLLRRELPRPEMRADVAQALSRQGFAVRVVESASLGVTGGRRVFVFAGRDGAVVDEAVRLDAALEAAPRARSEAMARYGALFGYPRCCVDAFLRAPDQDDGVLVPQLARRQQGRLRPEQNWAVVPLRPFSYLPCAPDCPATAELAARSLGAVAAQAPEAATAWLGLLSAVVLAWSFERFALLPGAEVESAEAVRYDAVLGHAEVEPGSAVAERPTLRAFEIEVLDRLRRGRRLVRRGDALVVERAGVEVERIRFAQGAPPVLDFTAPSALRPAG